MACRLYFMSSRVPRFLTRTSEQDPQSLPLPVIARHDSAEAISGLNSKLQALNPKQVLISKFQIQNPFEHCAISHLILLGI